MSEGKHTLGPFSRERSPISSDEVIFRQTGEAGNVGGTAVPVCRPVALLYETMDEAERDELVDLLNAGTAAPETKRQRDMLLEAARRIKFEAWQKEGGDDVYRVHEDDYKALCAAISACEESGQ